MKKLIIILSIPILLTNAIFSQNCDVTRDKIIINGSCTNIVTNGLSQGNYTLSARDQITFDVGFSLTNTNGHTFTANTDHTKVQQAVNDSASEVQGTSRTLDKTNCAPGAIGGSIDVSPTGAATYSIPLALPPGSHGMKPNIGIAYSSQGGNGLLGYGWGLSGLSAITRVNKNIYYDNTMAPVTLGSADGLILDGQRLISTGANTYSPENDPYSVVQYNSGYDYFIVTTKDGIVMEFGNEAGGYNYSHFKVNNGATYCWAINKITDPEGNYISFSYLGNSSTGEYRISEIKYTGNGTTAPYNSINFYYNTRTDVNTSYVGGQSISQTMILSAIKVFAENVMAKDYEFTYVFDGQYSKLNQIGLTSDGTSYNSTIINWGSMPDYSLNQTNPLTSYLSSPDMNIDTHITGDINDDGLQDIIQFIPGDGYPRLELALLKMDGTYSFTYATLLQVANGGGNNYLPIDMQVVDWDNDGKADILVHYFDYMTDNLGHPTGVYYHKVFKYSCNDGTTLTMDPTPVYNDQTDSQSDIYQFYYGDFNNNGKMDRIVVKTSDGYYHSIYDVTIDGSELSSSTFDNFENVYGIRVLDFDGDGQNEILTLDNNGYGEIFKYNGADFTGVYGDFTSTFFGKPTSIFMGDINGDGKTDYISYTSTNHWQLFYSTGTGFVAGTMPFSNSNDPATTASTLMITDVNRDGKEDIVYASSNNVKIYRSNGSSFTNIASYNPTTATGITKVRLFPAVDNNGQMTIIYVDDVDEKFLQTKFTNILDNNLIAYAITDGNNNTSTINYAWYHDPTTAELTYPLRVIRGPMRYGHEVKVSNGSKIWSDVTYSISGGTFHLQGKGFLGFTNFSASDNISNASTASTFSYNVYSRNGIVYTQLPNVYYPMLASRTTSKGGVLLSTINNNSGLVESHGGNYLQKFFFPLISSSTTTDNLKNFTTTNTIVTFNNTTGRVEDQISVVDGWTTETKPTYIAVSGNITKPTQVVTTRTKSSDVFTSTTTFTYGNGSKPLRVTSQNSQGKGTTSYTSFDAYGNVTGTTVHVTDAYSTPDRGTSCTYDSHGRFIVSSTDVAGLISYATYRPTDGAIISQTDPNGLVTSYNYSSGGNAMVSTVTLADGNKSTNTLGWDATGTGLFYTQKQITNGNTVTVYTNAAGWKLKETSIGYSGTIMTTTYDYKDDGSVKTINYPGISTATSYTYWPEGRIKTETGLNSSISYSYNNNSETVTDNISGMTKTTTVDGMGNVTQVTGTTGEIDYQYFGSGKVKQITTAGSTTSMTYDPFTLDQLTLTEPNTGTTTYTYNGFGQLKTQTDAKSQITTCNYDAAGRLTSKTGSGLTASYTYSSTQGTMGLLASASRNNVSETYTYDGLCRTSSITTNGPVTPSAQGTNFITSYQYNSAGQVASITYPTGLTVNYVYDATGQILQIKNAADGTVIWGNASQNTAGQWTQYDLGNGLTTKWGYDGTTQMLNTIHTGTSANNYIGTQNLGFNFNNQGQLLGRTDGTTLSESFTYDALDRLYTSHVTGGTLFTINYKPNGNIDNTTLAGQYTYNTDPNIRPHAVLTTAGIGGSPPQSPIVASTASYNLENKVSTYYYNDNSYKENFAYGIDGNRFRVDLYQANSLQSSKVFIDNSEFGYNSSGTVIYKRTIISAPTGVCAVYQDSGSVQTFYYIHTDYLGSWLKITDQSKTIVANNSYDAWGRPRDPLTWLLKTIGTTSPTADLKNMQPRFDRGYTGHEMMCVFGLVNMNGRLYDPYLQRFLGPDPYVQDPSNSQDFNRFSYCMNNPLRYIDPNGYTWLSNFGDWLGSIGRFVVTAVVCVIVAVVVVACLPVGVAALTAAVYAGAAAGAVGGILGAAFSGGGLMDYIGGAVSGAVIGGLSAYVTFGLFNGLGDPSSDMPLEYEGGTPDPGSELSFVAKAGIGSTGGTLGSTFSKSLIQNSTPSINTDGLRSKPETMPDMLVYNARYTNLYKTEGTVTWYNGNGNILGTYQAVSGSSPTPLCPNGAYTAPQGDGYAYDYNDVPLSGSTNYPYHNNNVGFTFKIGPNRFDPYRCKPATGILGHPTPTLGTAGCIGFTGNEDNLCELQNRLYNSLEVLHQRPTVRVIYSNYPH